MNLCGFLFLVCSLSLSSWAMMPGGDMNTRSLWSDKLRKMTPQQRVDKAIALNNRVLFSVVNGQLVANIKGDIETGFDINNQTENGMTYLHIAINYRNIDLFMNLVNKGASVTIPNSEGLLPLQYCAQFLQGIDKEVSVVSDPRDQFFLEQMFKELLKRTPDAGKYSFNPLMAKGSFAADIANLGLKYAIINDPARLSQLLRLGNYHEQSSWVFDQKNFLEWSAEVIAKEQIQVFEKITVAISRESYQIFLNELLKQSITYGNAELREFSIIKGARATLN